MIRGSLLTLICAVPLCANAQQIPLHLLDRMKMREIGPAVTSGRVTAIDVDPLDQAVIYAGTASGGLWKSESAGVTWTPIFDKQKVIGIGALKIDPSNPDVIWVGTGEGNPRNSQTSGMGVYRSPDGGLTWESKGLEATRTIHRMIVHPTRSEVVFAGATGSAWGPGPDRGVFRTNDNGNSWKKVLFVNDSVGCADLIMDPRNPDKLFAAMWQYGREPWFFNSGGKGSGLYMTLDGGTNWKKIGEKEGLPAGILGRIGLAIAPGNPRVVYALVESAATGLYRSTDGGNKWELVNDKDVNDRPFYYNEIYVDPFNENHLIYLHSVVSESIDGGKTWKTILPYDGVHPDHHAFWWSPKDPSFMIEGNDGGLNISRDGGKHWDFASNIPVAQFYHINYDMEIPYHVYGGMQDNGSWKGPGYVWHSEGIVESDWQEVLFGDGFDVVPDPLNSRFVYGMSQGGNLYRVDTDTGEDQFIQPVHPDSVKLRFNWNAAISADPHRPEGLYYGSQFLHYSSEKGQTWELLSPDLTSNDPEKQKAAKSGGLTIDATNAENHCTLLAIAPSPIDPNVIWVGTDDGHVQLTTDRGKTWKNMSETLPGMPSGAWVPQIVPSSHVAGEVWVVVNNYRQNDWKPYLFHSKDFGKTWKNLIDPKVVVGHCLSVVQDPIEPNLIFLGTEHGLFVSFEAGKKWHKWPDTYPSVATQDMKIHPREGDLIIGTFGRAAYILDNLQPLRDYAHDAGIFISAGITAIQPPLSYQANYARHKGSRFPADEAFVGENRAFGATLSFYIKFSEKQDLKDKKTKVVILSTQGDTLRWFTHVPDSGLNVLHWSFDTNGVRWPSREEVAKDADPPGGGMSVAPGEYKAVFIFDSWKDSTSFSVAADPRIPFNLSARGKREALYSRWKNSVDLAHEAFTQLNSAKKTLSTVRASLEMHELSAKKEILATADSIENKIGILSDKFMQPEGMKGIQDDGEYLTTVMWQAIGHLETGSIEPGMNAEYALRNFEQKCRTLADEINVFFEEDWKTWQNLVTNGQIPVFKDREKL